MKKANSFSSLPNEWRARPSRGAFLDQRFAKPIPGCRASSRWASSAEPRTDLYDAGIDPFLYYTNIISGNPIGGNRQGSPTSTILLRRESYLDKLISWPDAKVTISGVNRDGRGLTEHYVGSRFDVQQTVGGQNIFLYQVFLEQRFWHDKHPSRSAGSAHRTISMGRNSTAIISTTASTATSATCSSTRNFPLIRSRPGRRVCWSSRRRRRRRRSAFSRIGKTFSIAPITASTGHSRERRRLPDKRSSAGRRNWETTNRERFVRQNPRAGLKGLPGHYHIGGCALTLERLQRVRHRAAGEQLLWLLCPR